MNEVWESRYKHLHYGQLIFDKGGKIIQWGIELVFFQQMVTIAFPLHTKT